MISLVDKSINYNLIYGSRLIGPTFIVLLIQAEEREMDETINDLEVCVVDAHVWEVSLEELAQFVFDFNIKAIPYEKTEEGEMLLGVLLRTGDRIMDDGFLISRTIITNTLYAFVDGYKRLLVYDPIHKIIKYTDHNEETRYESTHIYSVTTYPHYFNKAVVENILAKLEMEKNKAL